MIIYMPLLLYIAIFLGIIAAVLTLRLLYVLRHAGPAPRKAGPPTRLLIVLGSGGHTAELLNMLDMLPTSRYTHRTYLVSSGDFFSAQKAADFEAKLSGLAPLRRKPYGSYDVAVVPRARKVHQSLLTTPMSCVSCFVACVRVLCTFPSGFQSQLEQYERQSSSASAGARRQQQPQAHFPFPALIVTNGPATGLIVVLAAVFLRFIGIRGAAVNGPNGMRAIFIESWARVTTLSLTGKILVAIRACQRVLVQWPALRERYEGEKPMAEDSAKGRRPRVEFVGSLVR